jgi:hypothetical protein
MTCYWNRDGKCRDPRIGGGAATEERCSTCSRYRATPQESPKVQVRVERKEPPLEGLPENAVQVKPGMLEKAASWIAAEASLITQGPVGEEEYRARLAACGGCQHLRKSEKEGELGWCKACGCGQNARAELTVKARMPKAKCPVQAWPSTDTRSR